MQRGKSIIVILGLMAVLPWAPAAAAENWVCAQDLNGDGEMTGVGETSQCTATQALVEFTTLKLKCIEPRVVTAALNGFRLSESHHLCSDSTTP